MEASRDAEPEYVHQMTSAGAASSDSEGDGDSSDDAKSPGRRWSLCGKLEPVLVPMGNPFWHRACLCRIFALLVMYVMLGTAGTLLTAVDSAVGAFALAVGPAAVIMITFYNRYAVSTTKRQAVYTYLEAMAWMVPLLMVIGTIDEANNDSTNRSVEAHCNFGSGGEVKMMIFLFSFTSECSLQRAAAVATDESTERAPAWRGLECPETHSKSLLIAKDGSFSKSIFNEILNVSEVSLDEEQVSNETLVHCPALQKAREDMVGNMRLIGVRVGGASGRELVVEPSRSSLGDLYSAVYGGGATDGEDITLTFELRTKTILNAFIEAYFRAGFLEELLKYVAVRRVLFKDRVVDAGGLIVYGLAAGAGFATAENVQYTVIYGAKVTYMRMLLSIPLHCCTGLIIGIHLGYRKFLGRNFICLVTLAVPVFIHGTYDFMLFLPSSIGFMPLRLCIVAAVLIGSFVYCRLAWLKLDDVCIVNVRSAMALGQVSKPRCCFCECDCCSAWFTHHDPLVVGRQPGKPGGPGNQGAVSGDAPARSTSSAPEVLGELARQVTQNLLPEMPKCQTTPTECPGCGARVHAHILYKSYCPHCGAAQRDEVLHASGSDSEVGRV